MPTNYLTVKNLSKSWGVQPLFQDISFGINEGQKIALIAANGTGKTTLLKILAGKDVPDSGTVEKHSGLRIGYLPQHPVLDDNKTVAEILFHFDSHIVSVIRKYHKNLTLYEKQPDKENENNLNISIQEMDMYQAWNYESKIKEILFQLDLTDTSQPVGTLSGGQRKKLALASVLIDETDLLIFDEPTNHLDIKTIEWLESYLSRQKQSLLMVTHDRYFLDNVCNEILELDNGQLYHYHGNYQYFLEKKAERIANQEAEIEKAKNLYRKELEWMRRQPKARAGKAKARKDAFYDLEKIIKKKTSQKQLEFSTRMSRQGKKILEIKNLSKRYGDTVILDNFSYIFKKGEKIGIAGDNGSGKTTFLNLITGKTQPDKGEIITGQTTKFGYFTQQNLKVNPEAKIIDIVKDVAEYIITGKEKISASVFLNRFGFDNELIHSQFQSLSGGEKRKLQLLLTLLENPNFLILDEPTNDLDIFTLEKLEEFLKDFPGCLLIVSHDRYFLDKLSDHLFLFSGNGKIKDFYGSYSDYKILKDLQEREKKTERKEKKERKKPPARNTLKATYKEKKEFEALEKEIEALEQEKEDIIGKMNSGQLLPEEFKDVSIRLKEIEHLLETKEMRWLELSEKM